MFLWFTSMADYVKYVNFSASQLYLTFWTHPSVFTYTTRYPREIVAKNGGLW